MKKHILLLSMILILSISQTGCLKFRSLSEIRENLSQAKIEREKEAKIDPEVREKNSRELWVGIADNNLALVKQAIKDGADLEEISEDITDRTTTYVINLAIECAASDEIVNLLIDSGAGFQDDTEAFFQYAFNCNYAATSAMLKAGQDPNVKTWISSVRAYSGTILATNNEIETNDILDLLQNYGYQLTKKDLKNIDSLAEKGYNENRLRLYQRVVMDAIEAGCDTGLPKQLQKEILGKDISSYKKFDMRDLKFIAAFGSLDNLKYAMGQAEKYDINELFYFSAIYNKLENMKYLVTLGADINTNIYKGEAVNWAIIEGSLDTATWLIDHGVNCNFGASPTARSVLVECMACGEVDLFKHYISTKGLSSEDMDYIEPYTWETEEDNECLSIMFDNGYTVKYIDELPDVESKCAKTYVEHGGDPNHVISGCYSDPELLQYLIDKGADVNTSFRGDEAIYSAIKEGYVESAKILFENGAVWPSYLRAEEYDFMTVNTTEMLDLIAHYVK